MTVVSIFLCNSWQESKYEYFPKNVLTSALFRKICVSYLREQNDSILLSEKCSVTTSELLTACFLSTEGSDEVEGMIMTALNAA